MPAWADLSGKIARSSLDLCSFYAPLAPVAAIVIMTATLSGTTPLAIVRRTAVPVLVGMVAVVIAARRPASLAALADVRGVGPAKLERYGAQFLAEVRAHDRSAPADGRNE